MTGDKIVPELVSAHCGDWIRVADQQPLTTEPILYAKPNGPGKWHVGIAYWTVSKTWNPEHQSGQAPQGFTHWKPLGAPPRY